MVIRTEAANQVLEVSLKSTEIFSIISSVASLILGLIAIWLSIQFYIMSDKAAKESEKSAKNIESNVSKLEKLFDKMYSDTFSMVKDTVTNMQKHAFTNGFNKDPNSNDEIAQEIEKRTQEVISKEVAKIQAAQLSQNEIEKIVSNLVNQAKKLEEDVKLDYVEYTIKDLIETYGTVSFGKLREFAAEISLCNEVKLTNIIKKLYAEGYILDPCIPKGNKKIRPSSLIIHKVG